MYQQAKSLTPLQQRKVAAILGACVADAATRPLHWIYNQSRLDSILQKKNPEFWHENKSPFYSRPLGEQSGYYDSTIVLLRSMVQIGDFDFDDYCKALSEFYGPDSPYAISLRERHRVQRIYDPQKKGEWTEPVPGPWMHMSTIAFLENYPKNKMPYGSTSDDTDGFCASIPLIAKYVNDPKKLESTLKRSIQILTASKISTERALVASKILCECIINEDGLGSLEIVQNILKSDFPIGTDIRDEMSAVISSKSEPHTPTVHKFGRQCGLPGNFQSALHALITSNNYVEAVRKAIRAGGCNCSRSIFVGATMGALGGLDAIPSQWVSKSINGEEVLRLAISLVTQKNKAKL